MRSIKIKGKYNDLVDLDVTKLNVKSVKVLTKEKATGIGIAEIVFFEDLPEGKVLTFLQSLHLLTKKNYEPI